MMPGRYYKARIEWFPKARDPEHAEIVSCPERSLAMAVVERTILDAVREWPSKMTRKQAVIDICEMPNARTYSFFWWLSAAFANAERILPNIQQAVLSGKARETVYQNGRRLGRRRVARAWGAH